MATVFVPIFPLPDATLFPHTLLPLHVFEARYRAMVTDALARDRRLAVVGLKPGYEAAYEGRPPVHPVAGVGRIVRCQRLATGRFDLLLRGECRVRIQRELPADTLYRMVAAAPLADVGGDGPAAAALAGVVRERCLQILEAVGRPTAELRTSLEAVRTPGALADHVAAALLPSAALRQALLEEPDVQRRLGRLEQALGRILRTLTGGR